VTERLAAGACVLFVDHDPARLARRVDERWRLAGGTVTVTNGAPTPRTTTLPDRNGVVVIEVTGLEAGSLAQLNGLAGVLSVHPGAAAGEEPGHVIGPMQVAVVAAQSDNVLRRLLSWDGLHVRAVHAEPQAGP
jgi:ABC-2 type transport system ATP-binding protein